MLKIILRKPMIVDVNKTLYTRHNIFCFLLFNILATICYAENVAEFCATFSKDCNKYDLHLVNEVEITSDSNLAYPDSACCPYPNCEIKWNYTISLQSPRKTPSIIKGDWFRSPRGLLSSFHICFHCDSCEVRRPVPLLEMKLNPLFQHSQLYENACKELKKYYGAEFLGKWNAQLKTTNISFEKKFTAKIVGECEKPQLLAEYCIDDNYTLHKTRIISYLSQKHLLDSFELESNGKYEYEKIMSIDLQEFGVHKIMSYNEQNNCKAKHVLWGGIRLPIPTKIDLKHFLDNKTTIRKLYMKEFTERWDIKYVSNNKIVKDFDEYKIRVIGKCNNNSIIPEESPMDYSQHWERKRYGQDSCQVYQKKYIYKQN